MRQFKFRRMLAVMLAAVCVFTAVPQDALAAGTGAAQESILIEEETTWVPEGTGDVTALTEDTLSEEISVNDASEGNGGINEAADAVAGVASETKSDAVSETVSDAVSNVTTDEVTGAVADDARPAEEFITDGYAPFVIEDGEIIADGSSDATDVDENAQITAEESLPGIEEDADIQAEGSAAADEADDAIINLGAGGTEDNPETIKVGTEYSVTGADDQSFYFKYEVKAAGTLTMFFEDDGGGSKWTEFAISSTPNPSDVNMDSYFRLKMRTHDDQNYAASGCDVTWVNSDLNTFKTSMIPGTYYVWVWPDDGVTFKFKFKDFTELKKASNETLLVDSKWGGNDHGSNDYYDFLDRNNASGVYYKNPMPEIQLNKKYRGILTDDSQEDYYHFELKSNSKLYLTANTKDIGELWVEIYYVETYGSTTSVQKETMSPKFNDSMPVTPAKPLSNFQLLNRLSVNHNNDSPTFAKGEYAIRFYGNRDYDGNQMAGPTGVYSFQLSTGSTKPVKTLKLDKTVLTMAKDGDAAEATLTATVGPSTAEDLAVEYSIDDNTICSIEADTSTDGLSSGQTRYKIKALKEGIATITITTNGVTSKKVPIKKTCVVSVVECKYNCTPLITKQKASMYLSDYFDGTYDKNDKWVIEPKGSGKISKGVFQAKKACEEVTVTRKVKVSGVYVAAKMVKFRIESPVFPLNAKGKAVKTFTLYKRDDVIKVSDVMNCPVTGSVPVIYECSDKAGKYFNFDATNGDLTVKATGKCKVTVYYCRDVADKANAAKYTYTVKATLPKIKSRATIKQGKSSTLSVSKLKSGLVLTSDSWRIYDANIEASGTVSWNPSSPATVATITPTANKSGNFVKCKVTAGSTPGYAILAVTVEGVEYYTLITIK